jgi:hypothetical protein
MEDDMNTQIANSPVQVPVVPDAIKVSPNETLLFAVKGKGTQIYERVPKKDNPKELEWTHVPEAQLFDYEGNNVGHHYAGPYWESTDGSRVLCDLKAHAEAKEKNAAPWLLLIVKKHEGQGVYSDVTSIQRLETVGGGEPADDQVKPGQKVAVPYTATYYCYGRRS